MELIVSNGTSPAPTGYDIPTAKALPMMSEGLPAEISCMRAELSDLRALVLSQTALLEQLARQQAQIRVSRSQEAALRRAVRARAGELAEREGLPARVVGAAILRTLREISGVRALGDVPAARYDGMLSAVQGWYMPGALRRIRRGQK